MAIYLLKLIRMTTQIEKRQTEKNVEVKKVDVMNFSVACRVGTNYEIKDSDVWSTLCC